MKICVRLHGETEKCGEINLAGGSWPVVVVGFQSGGGVYQAFKYKGPDTMNTYKNVRSLTSGAPDGTKGTAGQFGRWPPEFPYGVMPCKAIFVDNAGSQFPGQTAIAIDDNTFVFAATSGGFTKMVAVNKAGQLISDRYMSPGSVTAAKWASANVITLGYYSVSNVEFCEVVSQEPCRATVIDNVGTQFPDQIDLATISNDGTPYFVFGVISGGLYKMVAVDRAGTEIACRYMSSGNALTAANWAAATEQTLGYYRVSNLVICPVPKM